MTGHDKSRERFDNNGQMIITAKGVTVGPGRWCGTIGGYANHLCRCDQCRQAWARYCRIYQRARRTRGVA